MQHVSRIFTAALVAASAPSMAFAQDTAPAAAGTRAAPAPAPKYNWMEVDYVTSYTSDGGDLRLASQWGGRLSASLLLAKPFYFTGSFGRQHYDAGVGTDTLRADDQTWSAGFGAFLPVSPSTHLTVAATYEGGAFDYTERTAGVVTSAGTDDAQGYGLAAALRAQMTPSAEATVGYKFTDQTIDLAGGGDVDGTIHGFNAALVSNLSPTAALVLRMDWDQVTEKDGGDKYTYGEESYSLGIRFRL